jgi:hypothetical protein
LPQTPLPLSLLLPPLPLAQLLPPLPLAPLLPSLLPRLLLDDNPPHPLCVHMLKLCLQLLQHILLVSNAVLQHLSKSSLARQHINL